MAALAISPAYNPLSVLIADDEREHIEFFIDYLRGRGFEVTVAESAAEAFAAADATRFRAYFIDLNIPMGSLPNPSPTNDTYSRYNGLHIIQMIRTQGNAGARVVAYSAHYNDAIVAETENLYCKYIVKGRVKELKDVFSQILQYDPKS